MDACFKFLKRYNGIPCTLLLLGLNACTIQSSLSNRYLTAEKLWSGKNYEAAVLEFDRIVKESPNSSIGLQALWRASTTRTLFLNDQEEALKGFETFLNRASESELAPQAQKEIGEIYFSKLASYQKAIDLYEKLVASKKFKPEDESLFSYRVARSYFLINKIKKSIDLDELFLQKYPHSALYLRAKLDLGEAWYAIGDSDKTSFPKAIKLFQEIEATTKGTDPGVYAEAVFGEASAREELDQLEEAHKLYESLEKTYPAPNVVKVRMLRLEERMKKKRKS